MQSSQQSPWHRNIERQCPVCLGTYLASQKYLERGKQTTCSRRCSYVLRGREKKTSVSLVCAVCGTQFPRQPSHIKSQHGACFCSPRCQYAGRGLGLTKRVVSEPYHYTEEGLAKLRKTAARLYAAGETLAFPETERAVAAALVDQGINFTHQYVVELPERAFVIDFMFSNIGLAIELDHPGWHDAVQQQRDSERDTILRGLGITTLRVRDTGSPHDAVEAVTAALLQWSERRRSSNVG